MLVSALTCPNTLANGLGCEDAGSWPHVIQSWLTVLLHLPKAWNGDAPRYHLTRASEHWLTILISSFSSPQAT